MKKAIPDGVKLEDVDIWFQDESRIGQQGSQTRIWAKKGTRPRVVKQQQFISEYIYGAVCPAQKQCAAVILPFVNHEGLNEHLKEIAVHVPAGRHAVVVQDQAGWHHKKELEIPSNLSIVHLPPYSPELNPQEPVWHHLKDTYLANRVFQDRQEIVDACCRAWNAFAQMPDLIQSIATREWAILT